MAIKKPASTRKPQQSWSWTLPQILFFIFFATHIPITLCIDFQAVLPQGFYPQPLVDLVDWYTTTWQDPYFAVAVPERVGRCPYEFAWFRVVIWCEFFIQFPFFFVAVYAFWTGKNWIREPAMAYGGHVATTVVCIIAEFLMNPLFTISPTNLRWLLGAYIPYFVFPFWLIIYMWMYKQPFSNKQKRD